MQVGTLTVIQQMLRKPLISRERISGLDIARGTISTAVPLRGAEMHAFNAVSRKLGLALLAAGLAVAAPPSLANGIILSPVLTEQPFSAGNSSFLTSPAGGSESADSFTLSTGATITSISWWAADDDEDQETLGASGWQVRLADSADGLTASGSLLSGTTYMGSASAGNDAEHRNVFLFDFILENPKALSAGIYYLYLSNTNTDLTWWWATGTGGDGTSLVAEYANDPAPASFVAVSGAPDGDLSLQIRGEPRQAVPEPGTLALLGLAGMGVALTRRRKSSPTSDC